LTRVVTARVNLTREAVNATVSAGNDSPVGIYRLENGEVAKHNPGGGILSPFLDEREGNPQHYLTRDLGPFIEEVPYNYTGKETINGTRVHVYEEHSTSNAYTRNARYSSDRVTDFYARLEVTENGSIRRIVFRISIEFEEGVLTKEHRIWYGDLGTATVERPPWAGNLSDCCRVAGI